MNQTAVSPFSAPFVPLADLTGALSTHTACGFPGGFDEAIASVGVRGIDRLQAQNMVRLSTETEPILYGRAFSPRRIRYHSGARPQLEAVARRLAPERPVSDPIGFARAAMAWVTDTVVHPHLSGPLAADRALTEEQLVLSGTGWCNEQARVFIALCEIADIPARLCFLHHDNGRCGHAASEIFVCGRWMFCDVTFNVLVLLPDGTPAEARHLAGAHRELAHRAYRPSLEKYYRSVQPYVETTPWCRANRPDSNRGGDLFAAVGICNYVIDGVDAFRE